MAEEIRKSGLTFQEAKNLVDISIRDVKDGFVATGYYLWIIREERLWEDDGYNSFREFLHCQYQKDKSWASRCIGLYEQFGKQIEFGQLPVLAAPYRDYSVSQLIEMVSMTEEQREQVTPEMKVREIREMKPKREKRAAAPEEEVPAEAAGREPEGQPTGKKEQAKDAEPVATVATGEEQETSPKEKTQLSDVGEKAVPESGTGEQKIKEQQSDSSSSCPPQITGCRRKEWGTSPEEQRVGAKECSICWEDWRKMQRVLQTVEDSQKDGDPEKMQEEPLSAHGTPRKVYPEDSLIASAGCESEPGGFKGGYECFSCARECEIRQKDRYCAEAPLGKPFPCEMVKNVAMLWENVGDGCQFVNLDLAYHRQGDGEPVPCCKDCDDPCELKCSRVKGIIPVPEPEPDLAQEEPSDLDRISTPMEIKDYDRDLLKKMISDAERLMKVLKNDWKKIGGGYYTKRCMEIQAYKSLLAEHDGAGAAQPGLVENPDPGQPELPVLKNNDQRKEWLKDYKAWGLWYRDGYIDVNYYKFDFEDGSRLVAAEFPQRESSWGDEKYDQVYYHLIEHGRRKYKSDKMYEDKYQYHSTSETELIEYLKKLQQKRKMSLTGAMRHV